MKSDYEMFVRECVTAASRTCGISSDVLTALIGAMKEVGTRYIVEKAGSTLASGNGELPNEVNEYLSSCELEGQSKMTIANKRICYSHFLATVRKPLDQIETADVRKYLAVYKAERNISDRTMDGYRIKLNALFRWLYVEEYIPRNIMEKIKPFRYEKKQRRALDRFELEQFRSACRDPFETALVDIMFSTGCRVSELISMKLADIDWSINTITIYNGKGKKDRDVIFSDRAKLSLKNYLDHYRQGNGTTIFVHRRMPYNAFTDIGEVANVLNDVKSRTTIDKPISPHIIRHTFATLAYRNGMPLEELQVLMGHESIDTTRIYAEVDRESIRRSYEKCVV